MEFYVDNKAESDKRTVTHDEGLVVAMGNDCGFIEVSAKSNYGVDTAFKMCTREILKSHSSSVQDLDGIRLMNMNDIHSSGQALLSEEPPLPEK